MTRLLLTGFDTFDDYDVNISGRVVASMAKEQLEGVVAKVLPTSYARASQQMTDLIKSLRPAVILMTGQTKRTNSLSIELRARNADSLTSRDNDGKLGQTPIATMGPIIRQATIPPERIYSVLVGLGLPVEYSKDAGSFVCNHVFYAALNTIAEHNLPILCGLIHVPSPHAKGVGELHDLVSWVRAAIKATVLELA